ncbi:MAG: hypothetical protein ACREH3_01965 [Geminicoccales bacterium]
MHEHARARTEGPEIRKLAGRRFSPAVAAFVKAIKAYQWPDGGEAAS